MRTIALVGHRLAAEVATGVGRYYAELVRGVAAAAAREDRIVVASTREPTTPADLPPTVEYRGIPGNRKVVTLAWSLVGRPRVDRALGRPDVVHAMHAWAPTPTRAKLVVTIHDLMPFRHPDWYGRVETWSFRRGVRHAQDRADLIVTDSDTEAHHLVEHAGFDRARVRVIPLGIDASFRRRPSPDERDRICAAHGVEAGRYLVAVGAVSARKNLDVVLRALARLDPALLGGPALLVAGPRWQGSERVESLVAELGLGERVRFAGYVPRDDLPVLVGASLALVHPSRDEGFGLTPLEAMAAGVPALVARAGSLPEVVGGAGVVLDLGDPDVWADAIAALATDPTHRQRLVIAGDEHQARFQWERTAGETMAIYDELVGPR